MINQFSATSDVFKVSYSDSKVLNVNGDEGDHGVSNTEE